MPRYIKKSQRRRTSSQKKKSKQKSYKKGGNVLGKGTFGCVIRPNLPCINTNIDKGYISKLYDTEYYKDGNIKDDFMIVSNLKIKNMDGYDKHILIPIDSCNDFIINAIQPGILNSLEDIDTCNLRGKIFTNIIQKYGGISYDKFINNNDNLLLLLPYWCALFEAIEFLNYNGIVHRDIKENNITIESGNSLKLIDFGFAGPINEILINNSGNISITNPIYFYLYKDLLEAGYYHLPIELAIFRNLDINIDITKQIYSLDDIEFEIHNSYIESYKKYWLMNSEINSYNINTFIEISDLVKRKDNIMNMNNIKSINDKIKEWIININKKIDVFQLGVLLKRELDRLLLIDKNNEIVINELIKYVLNNMLNINSYSRHNITEAYENFKKICIDNGIDDIYLNSVNRDDII
jgi:serine/threonine protein kinase